MSTTVIVKGRKITADALDKAWPGVLVQCLPQNNGDTFVIFNDKSPIPPKTELEIITAQDILEAIGEKKSEPEALILALIKKGAITQAEIDAEK